MQSFFWHVKFNTIQRIVILSHRITPKYSLTNNWTSAFVHPLRPSIRFIFSILFSVHFPRCWQGEFVQLSRASLVGDHFLNLLNDYVLTFWLKKHCKAPLNIPFWFCHLQLMQNVFLNARCSSSSESHKGNLRELVSQHWKFLVIWAKIMSPLTHTMGLVYNNPVNNHYRLPVSSLLLS